MTERNTDNLGAQGGTASAGAKAQNNAMDAGASVQAQLEANERARKILEEQQAANNAAMERVEKNNQARRELRGKIDEIVDRQEAAEGVSAAQATEGEKAAKGGKKTRGGKKNQKVDVTTNEPPRMAEVNLVTKRSALMMMLKENKKILTRVGAGVGVVALVLVGVGVAINSSDDGADCRDDVVILDYMPEGYDGEVTDSTAAAVFNEAIKDKMESEEGYTYENASSDYENAYMSTEGEMRLDVLLSYAYFTFTETGDVEAAISILKRIYNSLTDDADIAKYYTAIINMYEQSGQTGQADYYRSMLNDLVESPLIPADAA